MTRPVRSPRRHARKAVDYQQAAADPPSRRSTCSAGSVVQVFPRSTTPQRPSSQRKSTTPGSCRSSRSSSRRSLFINQQITTNNRRPPMPDRSVSSAYARPIKDPTVLYHRSKILFESPQSALNYHNHSATLPREDPTSPRLPSRARSSITRAEDVTAGLPADEEGNFPNAKQHSNHMAATVMDWTLPSTRLREYRKIESSCRGIPGLWRRFGPRCLQRNRRLSFYDHASDDDAGSVRRYKLQLPEGDDEKNKSVVQARAVEPASDKVKWEWNCLASFRKSA